MNYDQFIGALCLWREARGQTKTALNAIWWVIQNRAHDATKRWPKTIAGVVLQKMQFSSFNTGDPNAVKFPVESAGADWGAWQDCTLVTSNPLGGDPTNGANHYESLRPEDPKPAWADPEKITLRVGPFRFYRL